MIPGLEKVKIPIRPKNFMSLSQLTLDQSSFSENRIAYSKCTIKHVLSPTQWGSFQQKTQWGATPWELKKLSQSYNPQYHTYFEYLMARYKTFLFQNDRDQHSWLFFFDRFYEIPSLPQWFIKWWSHLEAELKILPPFY